MTDITIRPMEKNEKYMLKNFLYEAIYQKPTAAPLPKDVIYKPEIVKYIDGFGGPDDICLIAMDKDIAVGAVWCRIFSKEQKGFGTVDSKTPELAISILKSHRNKGIGTRLMKRMIEFLLTKGYENVSLSVDKDNYAVRLYKNLGFEIIAENSEDFIMVKTLQKTVTDI